MEQILQTALHAGLEKPVRLLHVTDVHLVDYAEDDVQEQREHLIKRREVFRKEANYPPHTQNEYLQEAFRLAEQEGALPVLGGDVMDIYCKGTVREFHRLTDGHDFMFTPGSHEFAYLCRAPRPGFREYYAKARPEVEAHFPQLHFRFDSRLVGGLNVITMDNSEDYFRAEEFEKLKEEVKRGYPIVLFMHDPLMDHGLMRVNEPSEVVRRTEEEYRISDECLKFIGECPQILAVFSGHWHGEREAVAPCGKLTYVTPGLFKGICRMITVD